ncbi:MAG: PRC-barrel domain containing protein [Nonomuraea sp.]|nr:PRC-barrel domain containing protein [Nonomuraea sp.]
MELWNYRPDVYDRSQPLDLAGYHVHAADGKIGTVDEATYELDESYLVVDTGPWIFGKKVMLPASTITRIEPTEREVYVARTKEEIKDSPEYDEKAVKEPEYRTKLTDYYGRYSI